MDFVKKLWPTPFKIKKGNLGSFIWQLIVFVVIVAIAGVLIGLLAKLPIIGIIFGILGGLVGIYNTVGIVLCILRFLGIV